MRYILKGRGLGKTTDLVYLSAQTGIPIVCGHPDHVLHTVDTVTDIPEL